VLVGGEMSGATTLLILRVASLLSEIIDLVFINKFVLSILDLFQLGGYLIEYLVFISMVLSQLWIHLSFSFIVSKAVHVWYLQLFKFFSMFLAQAILHLLINKDELLTTTAFSENVYDTWVFSFD
jgi:hypothetical protein